MFRNYRPPFFSRLVVAIFDWNGRRQDRQPPHPITLTPWIVYLFAAHEYRHFELKTTKYFPLPDKMEKFVPTMMEQEFRCIIPGDQDEIIEVRTKILEKGVLAIYGAEAEHYMNVRRILGHALSNDSRSPNRWRPSFRQIEKIIPGPIVIK